MVKPKFPAKLENISWKPKTNNNIQHFEKYLRDLGTRDTTILDYVTRIKGYILFCGKEKPSPETAQKYREQLLERGLSASSVNNYCFTIRSYHKMLGQEIEFNYIKKHNTIPYYFSRDDINAIFSVIDNVKHLAMFKTAFYGCLRATELCQLNVDDVNFENSSVLVRNGKGGKSAVCPLNDDAILALKDYLEVRPIFEINGENPLFFTDYGNRFCRCDIYRLVQDYKKKAEVRKRGGSHVLFRHSPASLMVLNGCDLMTIQHVMRHSQITTTMRYLHLADDAKRAKYEKFLKL